MVSDQKTLTKQGPERSADTMGVFVDLWKQGSTLIVITHDMALARRASRIVEIRDGRIVSDRPAEQAA